jgi:hypothetical protein
MAAQRDWPVMGWTWLWHRNLAKRAFTASSILINGGQGRWKPSPGSLRVASGPGLVPKLCAQATGKTVLNIGKTLQESAGKYP